jgi:hypothetical protein
MSWLLLIHEHFGANVRIGVGYRNFLSEIISDTFWKLASFNIHQILFHVRLLLVSVHLQQQASEPLAHWNAKWSAHSTETGHTSRSEFWTIDSKRQSCNLQFPAEQFVHLGCPHTITVHKIREPFCLVIVIRGRAPQPSWTAVYRPYQRKNTRIRPWHAWHMNRNLSLRCSAKLTRKQCRTPVSKKDNEFLSFMQYCVWK